MVKKKATPRTLLVTPEILEASRADPGEAFMPLAETLRIVTAAVPGLRAAGVTNLTIGEFYVVIEPAIPDTSRHVRLEPDGTDFLDPTKFRRVESEPDGDDGAHT